MARIGFCGDSYKSQTFSANAQTCTNFYVERDESGSGKSETQLVSTPGLKTFSTLSDSPGRGGIEINGRTFCVYGGTLFELMTDGSSTVRGSVTEDSNPASFAASNQQVLVASGGNMYCLTLATNVFTPVASPSEIIQVGFDDSYFLALVANASKFYFSALLDATSWDLADVVGVSIFAGNIISMIVDHREIALLCDQKAVVYYDTGDSLNPFLPVPSGIAEVGCVAPFSAVRADNSVFWVGKDERGAGIAYRAEGYTPKRVSTFAIEQEWQGYSTLSDCVAYSYQMNGHTFVSFRFPTANKTWDYDTSTQQWMERGFLLNGQFTSHRSMGHTYSFGKHLVFDWNSARVYEMSQKYYDDFGNPIRRVRRSPYVASENVWLRFNILELIADMGIGLQAGQGSNPKFMLRWSDDNGETWSDQITLSAGKIGNYSIRAIQRRMGRCWGSHGRIFEISTSDPIPWRITDVFVDATPSFQPTQRLATTLRSQA